MSKNDSNEMPTNVHRNIRKWTLVAFIVSLLLIAPIAVSLSSVQDRHPVPTLDFTTLPSLKDKWTINIKLTRLVNVGTTNLNEKDEGFKKILEKHVPHSLFESAVKQVNASFLTKLTDGPHKNAGKLLKLISNTSKSLHYNLFFIETSCVEPESQNTTLYVGTDRNAWAFLCSMTDKKAFRLFAKHVMTRLHDALLQPPSSKLPALAYHLSLSLLLTSHTTTMHAQQSMTQSKQGIAQSEQVTDTHSDFQYWLNNALVPQLSSVLDISYDMNVHRDVPFSTLPKSKKKRRHALIQLTRSLPINNHVDFFPTQRQTLQFSILHHCSSNTKSSNTSNTKSSNTSVYDINAFGTLHLLNQCNFTKASKQTSWGTIKLNRADLKQAYQHLLSQFRNALLLPPTTSTPANSPVQIHYKSSNFPLPLSSLELDILLLQRIDTFWLATQHHLNEILKSAEHPQMAIPLSISTVLFRAEERMKHLHRLLVMKDKDIPVHALQFVRKGYDEALGASRDPAMVSRRFFPMEHLLAIYLPLLIPAFVPILASIKEIFFIKN